MRYLLSLFTFLTLVACSEDESLFVQEIPQPVDPVTIVEAQPEPNFRLLLPDQGDALEFTTGEAFSYVAIFGGIPGIDSIEYLQVATSEFECPQPGTSPETWRPTAPTYFYLELALNAETREPLPGSGRGLRVYRVLENESGGLDTVQTNPNFFDACPYTLNLIDIVRGDSTISGTMEVDLYEPFTFGDPDTPRNCAEAAPSFRGTYVAEFNVPIITLCE